MFEKGSDSAILDEARNTDGIIEVRRQEALLKTGALQNAILTSANFSIIATDEKGIIQLFNVGAERMLGYTAAEVMNEITPADISDPQEVIARAKALSLELGTPITPGFEALVFKASRGIEDIGIQALRILAEDRATAHIPVIALSANAMPRDIEKGLEAGFFRYLTKPIKVNEFMDTLDVALKFAKAQSARANSEDNK
jgi:CheY-like chemotaxis protein